jgi:hypothetical protein
MLKDMGKTRYLSIMIDNVPPQGTLFIHEDAASGTVRCGSC